MKQANMQNTFFRWYPMRIMSKNYSFNLSLGQGPKEPGPTDCWSLLLWPGLTNEILPNPQPNHPSQLAVTPL